MTTIGFATQYYTLWDVTKQDIFTTTISAAGESHAKTGDRVICTYIKNVSKDIEKVKQLYPNAPIDDTLRGMSRSFEYYTGSKGTQYAPDVFSKGYNKGMAISDCTSIPDLKWALRAEHKAEREANIKRQMVVLGMVEFEGSVYDNQSEVDCILAQRKEQTDLRKKSEAIYEQLANGGVHIVEFLKNINEYGDYYDAENGVSIRFPEYKAMYYRDFEYFIPSLKGVGKKVKGKTVELFCKTIEDTQYGGLRLLVESFKIL